MLRLHTSENLRDLPGSRKGAIEARTGHITSARIATAGQNSPLAAIIATADGEVFVKGMPSGHRRVITQVHALGLDAGQRAGAA